MTTITRFTKEQLISRADHLLCVGKAFIAEHPEYDGMAKDVELFGTALASLTAEPVGTFRKLPCGYSPSFHEEAVPLYAAPPAPVSVPDALPENDDEEGNDIDYMEPSEIYALGRTAGWNACRAAMLQGSQPVSNRDELLPSIKPAPELDSVAINDKSLPSKYPVIPECSCRTCRPVTMTDMRFVVCPECGNKRCPHANDHRNACTGSNEPGQEGSAYPAAPQQGV